jgi:glycosyltransferase involved in cell wall biosynthesis
MTKISFLIFTHNEPTFYLKELFARLNEHRKNFPEDEVVVVDDFSSDPDFLACLAEAENVFHYKVVKHALNNDFGAHKNFGTDQCTGDFVFQIDADEFPHEDLLSIVRELVESNPEVDVYAIPRVNLITGLTEEAAKKWGWHVSQIPGFTDPVINWNSGDYQRRLYRRSPDIRWFKRLHETLTGYKTQAVLPKEVSYALIHHKTIDRQENQNKFYLKNFTQNENMGGTIQK